MEECCFLQGHVGFHTSVLYHYGYVLMCRNIVLCDYCHPILTAIHWSEGCEPHLWQIGIVVNVACFQPVWFEWCLMLVVRLNKVLVLLWWCVQWVGISCKCKMWPTGWQGAVCRVQGKLECSAAVSPVPCVAVRSAVWVIPPKRTVFHVVGSWAVIMNDEKTC